MSNFKKVDTKTNFIELEHNILELWKQKRAFSELVKMQQEQNRPRWSFLDGPITANNPMGVHHAWGRTYKDVFNRFYSMMGFQLRYQNGYDCQGLWVEVEVEKQLGFKTKRDIETFGVDNFVQACKDRVIKYSKIQTEQSIRLGYWMDWDDSYYTMTDENNYTIWNFLKKCHNRNFIYKGVDVMPWCPRCGIGLSQMEMHEGYKNVAHRAIFVRFPLKGRENEHLFVWTTTPWTLTSNVACAVNPDLVYLKVRAKSDDAIYYFAQGCFDFQRQEEEYKSNDWPKNTPKLITLKKMFEKHLEGYEIMGEVLGKDMVGWEYEGPFDEMPAQQRNSGHPFENKDLPDKNGVNCHRVIEWNEVQADEGTGIVHIAPGCGGEDHELGKEFGLVDIAPLDESGIYIDGFDWLTGKSAQDNETTDAILESLKNKKALVHIERYPHRYPHCWRCNTELLYRLVDEWYIDMSWRDEIKENAKKIHWFPDWGLDRELDWLTNMRDWMISKKRYWGLALPIWVCNDCENFDVIGGIEELQEKAVSGIEEVLENSPHKSWIDHVIIKCEKCGKDMHRIPDVGNPWLDAGIVPYSTTKYNTDREYWKKWIPADLVLECLPGQFRNWFYALLSMSTMMENIEPFKRLFGHALVRDEHGHEMHKSIGNAIWFEDAAEKMGVDVMRWIYCRHNPEHNLNFGYTIGDEIRNRVFLTLWNSYAFFTNYAVLDDFNPNDNYVEVEKRQLIDKWILSDLQLLVKAFREGLSDLDIMKPIRMAERFIDNLSNWYIRRNRRRFWRGANEKDTDKQAAYLTLYEVLTTIAKILAPIIPFITEDMYQNLEKTQLKDVPISIHHCNYPEVTESLIDENLSLGMNLLIDIVSAGRSARNKKKLGIRQPLSEIIILSDFEAIRAAAQ
ncbi:MAG: isoleucine--tRNA ligase, partial [Planctomycetes bacterium]|nr:isoleucine--tRNA ligase [Planctomycetota bacterium]